MKIRVEMRVSGTNVWAYALDNDGVDALQEVSQESAIDIVRTKYVSGSLLTWGVDRSLDPPPSVAILLEGSQVPLFRTLTNLEDWELEESSQSASDYIRISDTDQIEIGREMETEVDMSSIKAIALESIFFEKILLWAEFDIEGPFDAELLRLYDNTMDCDTELSQALYPLGLPQCVGDGEENAILGVVYDGQKVQFESECSLGSPAELALIVRDDDGDWSFSD